MTVAVHEWDRCSIVGNIGCAVITHTLLESRIFTSAAPVASADQRTGIDYILYNSFGQFRAEYKTDTWDTHNIVLEHSHEYLDGSPCQFLGWVWKTAPDAVFYYMVAREKIFQLDVQMIRAEWSVLCRSAKRLVACRNREWTTYCRIVPIHMLADLGCIQDAIVPIYPSVEIRDNLFAYIH